MEVKLTTLGQLIEHCWSQAEFETVKTVLQESPSPLEEEVTFLFSGKLRGEVEKASATGEVGRAFCTDLIAAFPELQFAFPERVSGLIARVNLHGKWHEGKVSGADFGIVITRPLVTTSFGDTTVEFHPDQGTGLLAQAKLGRSPALDQSVHKWDELTKQQQRLFRRVREYYSLLLYRLDGSKANKLRPFGWQLCKKEHTAKQVQKWLRSNAFPKEVSSSEVLRKLFARTIGTNDPKIIRTIIDPASSQLRSLEIHIFWPKGAEPPSPLQIHQHEKQQVQQLLRH